MAQKSIAVLTSGGDAPGMNAAVRAVVRAGINKGMRVYGVYRGYNGLLNGDVQEMNLRSVSDIICFGGTMLYTARSEEFATPAGIKKAADFCRSIDVSGVVVIGGDGSFKAARALTNAGINCIGIPGTIDNDIACSEYTVGFDTAMNTALQMVDRIRDTAQSHDRCSIVEGWADAAVILLCRQVSQQVLRLFLFLKFLTTLKEMLFRELSTLRKQVRNTLSLLLPRV